MRRGGWLALLLLAPLALIAVGVQVALVMALLGAGQVGYGASSRQSEPVERGVGTVQAAARLLDRVLSSTPAQLAGLNPLSLGAVDDLSATAHAAAVASDLLTPLGQLGTAVVGFDGAAPMISGTTIDLARVGTLEAPVAEVNTGMTATIEALEEVPGSGILGRPIAAITDSLGLALADYAELTAAAQTALPALPEALGARGPRRYLICVLNDAEVFASGGAPLYSVMVEATQGTISVPIAGPMESELSPDNPPIDWVRVGGTPWYRWYKRYPFVNSNFHPDFRTAGRDMRRAWAALGFGQVHGVITTDVGALTKMLEWTGPIGSTPYGEISSDNLVRTLLVDSYRQFNSDAGVLERHARNSELTRIVADHLTSPTHLPAAVRGALDAIPPRHIQAWFATQALRGAARELGATGALAESDGDLIAVHSQSAPNKLSVFQRRGITQQVQLTPGGGAIVQRTIRFENAVPAGLEGDPTLYRGYLALRARMRVAYRLPLEASDMSLDTGQSVSLVPPGRIGPFPDDRGGQVLWQGHETAPREVTVVEMRYTLPDGTFRPGTYTVAADPQPLTIPPTLTIMVTPAPGQQLPDQEGWTRSGEGLEWSGTLDRSHALAVG